MPRKTLAGRRVMARFDPASMRPRPDAAENDLEVVGGAELPRASMRPRPDAAENVSAIETSVRRASPLQ